MAHCVCSSHSIRPQGLQRSNTLVSRASFQELPRRVGNVDKQKLVILSNKPRHRYTQFNVTARKRSIQKRPMRAKARRLRAVHVTVYAVGPVVSLSTFKSGTCRLRSAAACLSSATRPNQYTDVQRDSSGGSSGGGSETEFSSSAPTCCRGM